MLRRIEALTEPLVTRKPAAAPALPLQDVQLPSGLLVASLENYSPVSKIGVFVKAGSRYETAENLGVTHILRLASNLSTKGASAFRICRGLEAVGASLSVMSSREHMVYSLDCLREDPGRLTEYLINVTAAPVFTNEHNLRLIMLHLCVCEGVSHAALMKLGEQFFSTHTGAGAPGAVYRGGELRVQSGGGLVHALLACEGAAVGSVEANAFSVLQRLLGVGPHVKRGSNISSKLSQGIARATAQPFDATAFSATYSDSGLFGVYIISQADSGREVISAAMAQVTAVDEGRLTAEDLTRAKTQLLVDYLMSLESSEGLLEELGAQVLSSGTYSSPQTVTQSIESVTSGDVVKAAKKFVESKKTMSCYGHLANTPFVDEL
ncbi:cytochrome b-c1 complex subunit 2, mitochondrial-like [Carassius carassius]|uniref:cytochrome b-c1 complex subunit 2, mitochondrial-like n=1 Tax=Carassius carassius TaxID=217509 RepID=UPI0028693DF9|nr:cytochrome b-c1 complex subunit 2, mitochondrial-like [Carassius carassius]